MTAVGVFPDPPLGLVTAIRTARGQVACRIVRTSCRCASSSRPGFGLARPRLSTLSTVRCRPHSAGGSGGAGGTQPPSANASVDDGSSANRSQDTTDPAASPVGWRVGEHVRQLLPVTGGPRDGTPRRCRWFGERAGPVRARQPAARPPRRRCRSAVPRPGGRGLGGGRGFGGRGRRSWDRDSSRGGPVGCWLSRRWGGRSGRAGGWRGWFMWGRRVAARTAGPGSAPAGTARRCRSG